LIALIIDAHCSAAVRDAFPKEDAIVGTIDCSYKDQFASNTPEDVAVKHRPLTVALALARENPRGQSDVFPLHDVNKPAPA
jgi:hypothetical protein